MSSNDTDMYESLEDVSTQTLIQNRYCFWYHRRGKQTVVSSTGGAVNYEEAMKKIANFQTVFI